MVHVMLTALMIVVQIVAVNGVAMQLRIIAVHAMQTAQMTVCKIVLVHGVVLQL